MRPHYTLIPVGVPRLAAWLLLVAGIVLGSDRSPGATGSSGVELDDDSTEVFKDDFQDRHALKGAVGQWVGSNAKAGLQESEPRLGDKRFGHSVWASYKASSDGVLVLSTEGSRFDTLIGVYWVKPGEQAADFSALVPVAFEDDEEDGRLTSKLMVPVKAGAEYAVVVAGFGRGSGDIVFSWAFAARAGAIPSVMWVSSSQSVAPAARVVLSAGVANPQGAELRWLRNGEEIEGATSSDLVIPSFSDSDIGRYRLRIRLSDLEVRSEWVELQLNSEASGGARAQDKVYDALETPLRAERSGAAEPASSASARMARLQAAAPGGVIRGLNGTQVFSTSGATREPDEPVHCGTVGGASYWFAYEAAEEGTLHFDANGTGFPAILAAYTFDGSLSSYAQLSSVGCDVADAGGPPSVDLRTEPGRTYLLVLDGVAGARGLARLNYQFVPGPIVMGVRPSIVGPDPALLLAEGQPLVLSATVTGTAPLGLRWLRDGLVLGGANAAEYRVAVSTVADSGSYRLEATNAFGSATGVVAVVEVLRPPSIVVPLEDQSAIPGAAAAFTAAVSGSVPLGYRWFREGVELVGKTTATLAFPSTSQSDAGGYSFVAWNAVGSVTSRVARLQILVPPTLIEPLGDRWVEAGSSATLEASVAGSEPMTFAWFRHGTRLPGQTTRVLTLPNVSSEDSGFYGFVASNPVGEVTGPPAWVEVLRRPEIEVPLADRRFAVGASVVLQAAVRGDPPLTFRWYRDGVRLDGASGPELALPRVSSTDSGLYSFEVFNPVGGAVSTTARVEVLRPPEVRIDPALVRRALGQGVVLTASLEGDGPFRLQWFFGPQRIEGGGSESLVLTNLVASQAGEYRLEASNAVGTALSSATRLEVVPPPTVTLVVPAQIRPGDSAELLARVEGATAQEVRWYRNGSRLAVPSGSVLRVAPALLTDSGLYRVEADTDLGMADSGDVRVWVADPVLWTQLPAGQSVAAGTRVVLSAQASGTPPLLWQWRKDGVVLAAETNAVLVLAAAGPSESGIYTVGVSNVVSTLESDPIPVQVAVPPRIVAQPVSVRVGRGGTARLSVLAEAGAGGRIAWRKDGHLLQGLGGPEILLPDCTPGDAGAYHAEVENAAGRAESEPARLEVLERTGLRRESATGRVVLGLLVPFGVGYRVETSTALEGPWVPVVEGFAAETALAEFPFPIGSAPMGFFRFAIGPSNGVP